MFLVTKAHLRQVSRQLRTGSFVYALQQPKTPAIQFRDLDRVKWELDSDYDDTTDESGFVTLREGDTVVDGRMWMKGKWMEPPIHLEIQWAFKYDPQVKDYQWRAIFRPESSHVLVNDKGKPVQQISTGDWLMLRKALGKDPFVNPSDELKKLKAASTRLAAVLGPQEQEEAAGIVEAALDGCFKEFAIQFGIPHGVWNVLDDAGLREEFEEFARRYVQELVVPWYDEATRR